jgi:small subunit ribosomal protein S11
MTEEKTQIEEIEEQLEKEKINSAEKENLVDIEENADEQEQEEKAKKERIGILHIYTTKNNTALMVTDMAGNTIAKSTGGQSTKQNRLKSSPTVAMFSAKKIGEEAREAGITSFYVRVRAETGSTSPGSASHAVIKSLSRDGFKVLSIVDMTKHARGGPKKKGGRRGRRV